MSKAVDRLFEGFQPEHYDLTLDISAGTDMAVGTVVIKGKKTGRPGQRLTLHTKYLKIKTAEIIRHDRKLGDQPIVVSRINLQKSFDQLRLHSDDKMFAGDYTVKLAFEAPVQSTMHGIYKSAYRHEGVDKQIISTQLESHHAREAFPCIDEPEAKATFDLTLITPLLDAGSQQEQRRQIVISNLPAREQTASDGKLTSVFQTSPRMSTYLLAFAVGDMQQRQTETKDGVSVAVYATRAHASEALDFALDTTKRCIEFFNDYYGVPYPLPKCDMVAIPDFSSAAMENWGMVTYREPFLLADPATTAQSTRELIATVICHELSHQWFGNLVTMKWWDDLWLNESFANVMEYVAVDALFPDWHVFNTFAAQEGLAAFRRDSIPGVQSIKTEVRHPDEISTLFDPSIVYAKGGRLLNMLRSYIGEDDFRAGLKQYFERHKYGNTTGSDLWAALAEASGKDVAAFMDPWLQRSGFPLVTIDQKTVQPRDETGERSGMVSVSQEHFLVDPAKADPQRVWPVPLLAGVSPLPELLETKTVSRPAAGSAGYIRLNRGAVGHYVVRYRNPEHMSWLARQAADGQLSEAERLMLLSDSLMLARSGIDSLAASLRLLDHYAEEASDPVWDIIALVIADSRRFVDGSPEMEDSIKALIRRIIEIQYQRLGWQEISGESSHDTKLRATVLGLGTYAEYPAIKQRMLELFEAYVKDPAAVASELRGIAFTAAVRFDLRVDGQRAFDYLLAAERETGDPNLKQELIGSLSATRSVDDGGALIGRLKDVKQVRLHDVDHWLILLMRNRYNQQQSWDWLRDNWQWIETTFAGDKSYDSFPRYAASAFNTRQRLQEYRDFFGPKSDQTVLERNIAMGVEELESRITWIERDLPALHEYFSKL